MRSWNSSSRNSMRWQNYLLILFWTGWRVGWVGVVKCSDKFSCMYAFFNCLVASELELSQLCIGNNFTRKLRH